MHSFKGPLPLLNTMRVVMPAVQIHGPPPHHAVHMKWVSQRQYMHIMQCMSRNTCNMHVTQNMQYACHATPAVCLSRNTCNMHVVQHIQYACHATQAICMSCDTCNAHCAVHIMQRAM